jgi:S-adenosylmethionine:tRNA ribosyltransferase-isomerase
MNKGTAMEDNTDKKIPYSVSPGLSISDYDYSLPEDRIAQYPVKERDCSRLLVYRDGKISSGVFRNIVNFLPAGSLLVFNNTRVIRARLLFRKESGALIEILCLEPLIPESYELSFSSRNHVEWKCIIGNLKKWKKGNITLSFVRQGKSHVLTAEKLDSLGDAWRVRFSWDAGDLSFGEVIESAGHIPLPPYIRRHDEESDNKDYQTVYSRVKGSVAAPTAGLHFSEKVLESLSSNNINKTELTLHVGAGTFRPVNSDRLDDHEMHCENFFVPLDTIKRLRSNLGKIISVGTTSLRTLESIYWAGVQILEKRHSGNGRFIVSQWEHLKDSPDITAEASLEAVAQYMIRNNIECLNGSTSLIIVPGYRFRMIEGLITNFHQPRSTLLLLVSAWAGNDWKKIYGYALENNFRFLSYGDSSLLFKPSCQD